MMIALPYSGYDHENVADDAKNSNDSIAQTEHNLHIWIEDEVLMRGAGCSHDQHLCLSL